MTNVNGIEAGQTYKVKPESDRVWRDETITVSSVTFEHFKDEYLREWSNDLILDHYNLFEGSK